MENELICGRNAVKEALVSGRKIDRILISSTAVNCKQLTTLARSLNVVVKVTNPAKFKEFECSQGVVAYVAAVTYYDLKEVLSGDKANKKVPFFLICDKVLDPHNLGALIRTAFAAGVSGVVVAKRECCPITSVVEKASAGAINFVKIIRVSNLAQAIDCLKKAGVFVYCADLDGKAYFKQNLTGPIAIVVGSEGKGISCLLKKKCDGVLTIPMIGKINSLNVSVAGGLLMFEVARQNGLI